MLDLLHMLSSLSEEQWEEEARDAWNLMTLDGTKDEIPEKSFLMFVCSVLAFEKEFIFSVSS